MVDAPVQSHAGIEETAELQLPKRVGLGLSTPELTCPLGRLSARHPAPAEVFTFETVNHCDDPERGGAMCSVGITLQVVILISG